MQELPMQEGFPVAPMSRLAIQKAAQHARQVLGLPQGRIDAAKFLDELTSFGIYYDVFDRGSELFPLGVEACYIPEERTVYIRDTVYDDLCGGGARAQFTIGHELGHAVLAHRRTYNRLNTPVPIYCNSEWQANVFAAEFIMPRFEINERRLYTADAIANYFGVSMAAARNRLTALLKAGELK